MELVDVVRQNAGFVQASRIAVTVNRSLPTVAIRGPGVDVFLQGHEAEEFTAESARLWKEGWTLSIDEVYQHQAFFYL